MTLFADGARMTLFADIAAYLFSIPSVSSWASWRTRPGTAHSRHLRRGRSRTCGSAAAREWRVVVGGTLSGSRLDEHLGEPVRHVDHHVVTARQLAGAPRRVLAQGIIGAVEPRIGVALGANIGLARDALARAGERNRVREGRDRLRDAQPVDPGAVGRIDPEGFRGPRRDAEIAALHRRADRLPHGRTGELLHALAILRHEGVEENECADRARHLLGDTRDDEAAVGMAAQDDVAEPLTRHHVDDIFDVGREADPGRQLMRALAEPGQRRRTHHMPPGAQPVGDAPPAPTAVPRTVDQDERTGHGAPPWLPRSDAPLGAPLGGSPCVIGGAGTAPRQIPSFLAHRRRTLPPPTDRAAPAAGRNLREQRLPA